MATTALPRPGQTKYLVLEELIDYTNHNAFGPTMEELAEAVGVNHRSTVHKHLHDLMEDELVVKEPGRQRGFQPTPKGKKLVQLLNA